MCVSSQSKKIFFNSHTKKKINLFLLSEFQFLFRFLYYSYSCSNQGKRFTGTINWMPDRDLHGVCISCVPPSPGWTDCILSEVRAVFLPFVRYFSVQGYRKLYTQPHWSRFHKESPYWTPWRAFCSNYPAGAVSTSLQIFDDTNKIVNQIELP